MKMLFPQGKQGDSIRNIRVGYASEITEDGKLIVTFGAGIQTA